jgi:hypothetical protein
MRSHQHLQEPTDRDANSRRRAGDGRPPIEGDPWHSRRPGRSAVAPPSCSFIAKAATKLRLPALATASHHDESPSPPGIDNCNRPQLRAATAGRRSPSHRGTLTEHSAAGRLARFWRFARLTPGAARDLRSCSHEYESSRRRAFCCAASAHRRTRGERAGASTGCSACPVSVYQPPQSCRRGPEAASAAGEHEHPHHDR